MVPPRSSTRLLSLRSHASLCIVTNVPVTSSIVHYYYGIFSTGCQAPAFYDMQEPGPVQTCNRM